MRKNRVVSWLTPGEYFINTTANEGKEFVVGDDFFTLLNSNEI